jgi:hypothetical protein
MRGDRARGSQHACLLVAASREAKQRKMKEGRQSKIFMRQCIQRGAGDGARTRDSLLGRQELYH